MNDKQFSIKDLDILARLNNRVVRPKTIYGYVNGKKVQCIVPTVSSLDEYAVKEAW